MSVTKQSLLDTLVEYLMEQEGIKEGIKGVLEHAEESGIDKPTIKAIQQAAKLKVSDKIQEKLDADALFAKIIEEME